MHNLNPFSNFLSNSKYGRQIFAAFAANMGAFSFGTAWAYTATSLPRMKQDADLILQENSESLLVSLLFLGCIIASPINGYCIHAFGPRMTMLITNIPCTMAWILIALAKDVEQLYIGRLITGICSASYGSAAALYISEISSPSVRGRLVCCFDTMIAAGMVFANIVGSFSSWRVQAYACAAIPVLVHSLLLCTMESPRYLSAKGKVAGFVSLKFFNPTESYEELEATVSEISNNKEKEKVGFQGLRFLFDKEFVKPILIGVTLMFFHLFSGNYPILAYGLEQNFTDESALGPFLGITLMDSAQLIFSVVPVFFVDAIGRRPLLIISEIMMGVALLSAAGTAFLLPSSSSEPFTLFALVVYEIFYALGIGPLPWLLLGEMAYRKNPGLYLALITGFYRVTAFLQLHFYPQVVAEIGKEWLYVSFAFFSLVGAIFFYFVLPDTTNRKLEDVQNEI